MAAKRKAKKKSFYNVLTSVFHIILAVYVVVCIGVKVYNVTLNRRQIEIEKKITTYQAEVGTISAQISELQDYNRVVEYVDTASMKITTAHSIDAGN